MFGVFTQNLLKIITKLQTYYLKSHGYALTT